MAYSDEVLADAPTAYWRLDETSGTTLVDSSGNGLNGTYGGAPTLGVPSLLAGGGTAVDFDGVDDYATVPNSTSLNAQYSVTLECWVRVDDPTESRLQTIVDKTAFSSTYKQWAAWWDNRSSQGSPQRLSFHLPQAGIAWSGADAQAKVAAGGHLVCRYDSATSTASIWWDGVKVAEQAVTPSFLANARPVLLGGTGTASEALNGRLDEFAFYRTALPDARITAHYQAGSGGNQMRATIAGAATVAATLAARRHIGASLVGEAGLSAHLDGPWPLATSLGAAGSLSADLTRKPLVATDATYSNLSGYNYTGTGQADYDPPVAPTPARVRRAKVRHVHQSLPAPTLVDGRPT